MKIIAGLGNPGTKYTLTRHNAGFIVLDHLADNFGTDFKPGKGEYYEAKAQYNGEDFVMIKPTTYMNNSGIAVLYACERYEVNPRDVLIVYDDFQIPLGTLRLRPKGSDGGHNGISSIIYHLNTDEFPRLKVGIGTGEVLRKDEFIDFVLGVFRDDEIEKMKQILPYCSDCIKSFLKEDIKVVMNNFNKSFL